MPKINSEKDLETTSSISFDEVEEMEQLSHFENLTVNYTKNKGNPLEDMQKNINSPPLHFPTVKQSSCPIVHNMSYNNHEHTSASTTHFVANQQQKSRGKSSASSLSPSQSLMTSASVGKYASHRH